MVLLYGPVRKCFPRLGIFGFRRHQSDLIDRGRMHGCAEQKWHVQEMTAKKMSGPLMGTVSAFGLLRVALPASPIELRWCCWRLWRPFVSSSCLLWCMFRWLRCQTSRSALCPLHPSPIRGSGLRELPSPTRSAKSCTPRSFSVGSRSAFVLCPAARRRPVLSRGAPRACAAAS